MGYSTCKKLIDVLVLNFMAMFSARVRVRQKDLCIVFTTKQQKGRYRPPVTIFVCQNRWSSRLLRVRASFKFKIQMRRHQVPSLKKKKHQFLAKGLTSPGMEMQKKFQSLPLFVRVA